MRRFIVLLSVVGLVGCADVGSGTRGARDSGIEGRVVAGPTCPVEIQGSPCPPKPVRTTVRVLAASPGNRPVTTFESAEDGTFRVPLEPGRYLLVAEPGDTGALAGRPIDVTVEAGAFTEVDVLLDTGLRPPAAS